MSSPATNPSKTIEEEIKSPDTNENAKCAGFKKAIESPSTKEPSGEGKQSDSISLQHHQQEVLLPIKVCQPGSSGSLEATQDLAQQIHGTATENEKALAQQTREEQVKQELTERLLQEKVSLLNQIRENEFKKQRRLMMIAEAEACEVQARETWSRILRDQNTSLRQTRMLLEIAENGNAQQTALLNYLDAVLQNDPMNTSGPATPKTSEPATPEPKTPGPSTFRSAERLSACTPDGSPVSCLKRCLHEADKDGSSKKPKKG